MKPAAKLKKKLKAMRKRKESDLQLGALEQRQNISSNRFLRYAREQARRREQNVI